MSEKKEFKKELWGVTVESLPSDNQCKCSICGEPATYRLSDDVHSSARCERCSRDESRTIDSFKQTGKFYKDWFTKRGHDPSDLPFVSEEDE